MLILQIKTTLKPKPPKPAKVEPLETPPPPNAGQFGLHFVSFSLNN